MKTIHRLLPLLLLLAAASLQAQIPLGPQFRVSLTGSLNLLSPRVAINASGEFVVLWYGPGDAVGGILRARRFATDGTPASGEIQVAEEVIDSEDNLAVALQDDGSFLALFSVPGALKLRRFAPDGTRLLDEQIAAGSPYVPAASISLREDGRFVIAWNTFDQVVSVRVFNPDGSPRSPVVAVAEDSGPKFGPWVAMDPRGSFVVVWQTLLGPSAHIQARRYGPAGHPRGPEILVSDHFGGGVRLAKDGAGDFLVTWAELPSESGLHGIYGRRYSAAGLPSGGAMLLIPSFMTGSPDLAMAPDGSFVLAWDGPAHTSDVYAQVFAADGVPPRPAFTVPQPLIGVQRRPRVALNGMGRFVVVWESVYIDGRRFKARRP
jgi:hypothetical protein